MEKIRLPKIDVTELEGTTFQEYAIQKVLGQGGMAIVYQAFDQRLESSVALKFLLPEHARHALVRKRFLSEARLQYKLRHPHLVRVTGLIEEGNLAGVVMDFVEGRDLSVWLKERRSFSLKEIQDLFLPILSAVGYAHSQKIIHRDLKPSNVLVERRGEGWHPYVMDFGIAKALDQGGSQTKTGTFLGSPDYTSPEQISGDKAIDHRTDIYALGCTLYELLVGAPPFAIKQTIQQIFFAHLAEPPPSLEAVYPKVGSQLDRLLASALDKDRNKRFPSCEAFASEVVRVFTAIQTLPPPLKGPFYTRTTEESVSHFGATHDLPPSSSKVFVQASFVEAPPSLPPPSLRPPLETPLPESADGPQPTGSFSGERGSSFEIPPPTPTLRSPLPWFFGTVLFFLTLRWDRALVGWRLRAARGVPRLVAPHRRSREKSAPRLSAPHRRDRPRSKSPSEARSRTRSSSRRLRPFPPPRCFAVCAVIRTPVTRILVIRIPVIRTLVSVGRFASPRTPVPGPPAPFSKRAFSKTPASTESRHPAPPVEAASRGL